MPDLRACQPSFTAGELSPALWARVDLAKYASGLKTAINMFIHPHGGASNRAGLEFINAVRNSASVTRLIPFQFNVDQSYILEFGHKYVRVYRDGGLVLSGGAAYEFVTPYAAVDLDRLVTTQEADVMYITHTGHAPRKLSRLADDNWSLSTPGFAPVMTAPNTPAIAKPGDTSGENGYTSTLYRYRVSAVSAASGEESLPSGIGEIINDLSISGGVNRVLWNPVPGASRYIVYKEDNGVYGYIGGTEFTVFYDENITADLSDTPQTGYNPFVGKGNYPACSCFVDQRLAFGSTLNNPQAVWLSQTGNYENFGYSRPRKASDGFEFRIRARQVNVIRSLLQMRGLMTLTSGGEWVVTGGPDEYLAPDNIVIKSHGYRGAAPVQPVVVGNTVLFAQERGGVVRDFSYEFTEDSFTGKDLTILARHMFEGRQIKAWAYAQAPHSIVWVVLDDGSLCALTYIKEHDVWAWTRHQTDGVFEDVAVIGEGREDVAYFIVRRTVNGVQKRYIERLHERAFTAMKDAFFVDSGLSYSGAPVSAIMLPHLAGKEVVALCDGNVVRGLTADPVTGAVTLPYAASSIHAGLAYEATLQTLDLDLGAVQGLGSVQARSKSVSEISLRVEKTRGIWVGPKDASRDSGKLIEYKQRANEAWNAAIGAYTGDLAITPQWDWTGGGNLVIKQFDPLPMTILAVMPDITIGR